MSQKTGFSAKLQLLTLLAVLLLVAIFFAIPSKKSSSSTKNDKEARFALQDTANISQITLGDYQLSKAQNGWVLSKGQNSSFLVDKEVMKSFWAIMQRIEIKRPASESILETLSNEFALNGTSVSVFANQNKVRDYVICEYDGQTYAKASASNMVYAIYIPGYYVRISEAFAIRPQEWRNRTLIQTTPNTFRNLGISYPEAPSRGFVLEFSGKSFGIKDMPEADTTKVYDYLPYFSAVRAERFIADKELLDSLNEATPLAQITLNDVGFGVQKLSIYNSRKNYLGIQEQNLVLLNPNFVNRILLTRSDFLSEN